MSTGGFNAGAERPVQRDIPPRSSLGIGTLRQLNVERKAPNGSSAAPEGQTATGAMERFLCEECGETIGVYEPLVVGDGEDERTTSRAAEPELRAGDCSYYHRDCHAADALTCVEALNPPR